MELASEHCVLPGCHKMDDALAGSVEKLSV